MQHLINTFVILLVVWHLGDIETLLVLLLGLHLLGLRLSKRCTSKERRICVGKKGSIAVVVGEDVE